MKVKTKIQKAIDEDDSEILDEFCGGSDGFWYDLVEGGYFIPSDVLAHKSDLKKVNDAIKVLRELEEVYNKLRIGY